MSRAVTPARAPLGIFRVQHFPTTTGQTFKNGALVKLSSGQLVICTTNDTAVVGVAGAAAFNGRGWELANASQLAQAPTGRDSYLPVYVADQGNIFASRLVDSNVNQDTLTPAVTDIGVEIGVLLDSGGNFCLDKDASNDVAVIVDINIDEKLVFFKFLAAASQID